MKNLFSILLLISCSNLAFAQIEGFQDTNLKLSNISDVLKMNDNSFVKIQGNIIKQISDDKYTFKDSTGSITVEIDNDKWQGLSANTKDKLEIIGEIEKNFNSTKLDAESINKVIK